MTSSSVETWLLCDLAISLESGVPREETLKRLMLTCRVNSVSVIRQVSTVTAAS